MSKNIDPAEWKKVAGMIDQIGKGTLPKAKPKTPPPPKASAPQVIRERKDPELIREDPLPQPVSEKPTPRAVGDAPGPTHTGQVTAQPQPEPQLIQLVKLYQQLGERDRRELLLIAMMKVQLSNG